MPCNHLTNLSTTASRYQHGVKVGNWFEEKCLEEEKTRKFKEQRDRGELVVNKARALFDKFFQKHQLDAPKEDIHFGAVIQLSPYHMNLSDRDTSDMDPALSVNINGPTMRRSQTISEECELTVSLTSPPSVRNAFRIISGDKKPRLKELLRYGQHFRLECVEPVDDSILLYTAPKLSNLTQSISTTFSSFKHGEMNLPVGLVRRSKCGIGQDVPLAFTNWFCTHIEPSKRFESLHEIVPSNSPLVIVHAATNKNLAVENVVVHTLFGPEFLVSVQNYQNKYKRETWQNRWMIFNGQRPYNIEKSYEIERE